MDEIKDKNKMDSQEERNKAMQHIDRILQANTDAALTVNKQNHRNANLYDKMIQEGFIAHQKSKGFCRMCFEFPNEKGIVVMYSIYGYTEFDGRMYHLRVIFGHDEFPDGSLITFPAENISFIAWYENLSQFEYIGAVILDMRIKYREELAKNEEIMRKKHEEALNDAANESIEKKVNEEVIAGKEGKSCIVTEFTETTFSEDEISDIEKKAEEEIANPPKDKIGEFEKVIDSTLNKDEESKESV